MTRNRAHSCGHHTIEQFMEGKTPVAWAQLDDQVREWLAMAHQVGCQRS